MNVRFLPLALGILMVSGGALASDLPRALSTGNPLLVDTAEELYAPILTQIANLQKQQLAAVNRVFASNAINYTPGQSSQIFNILDLNKTWPLVTGNNNRHLAVAGREGYGYYTAWGSNIPDKLQTGGLNAAMATAFSNNLAYVLKVKPYALPATLQVTLAFMSGSELTNTRNWLKSRFPNWTVNTCNDPAALNVCLMGSQLILSADSISDAQAPLAAATLLSALRAGAGMVYLHNRWSTNLFSETLAQSLKVEMPYAGNWFAQDSAQWVNGAAMLAGDNTLKQLARLTQHLKNNHFPAFDWSRCTSSVGTTSCQEVPGLASEFSLAADYLRATLRQEEQNGRFLFRLSGNSLLKLFVLLGDKYRQQTRYPLDKQSGGSSFLKAYLADHLNVNLRAVNPPQADTGTFSSPLPPGTATVSRDLVIDLGAASHNRSTGLYALPGTALQITRLDTQPVNVGMYLNSIRSGSTRQWNTNGLARPKYLQSPVYPVTTTALTLVSPHGGPVYLSVPPGSGQIRLRIKGAAAYPYLDNLGSATAISTFQSALESSPFSWAGIRTDFVDINSRNSMLKQTINGAPYNGNLGLAMSDIWTYMIKGTYELAGFSGSGLSLPAAVQARCTSLGWDCGHAVIHARPAVQHITVDTLANCGSGCSGNPYDQDWALSPLGWGETHEIGHNLQRGRLKIYGGKSSEVSNNIFPSYKGWQYYQATGIKVEHCTRGHDPKLYTWLQEAHNTADPAAAMYQRLWSQTGIYDNAFERLAFYLQLAYAANPVSGLDNGWQVFPLMYLHERLFSEAIKDAASWSANRQKLGFGTYATAPTGIDGNDFMLISYSLLTGHDQRPFFNAWGVTFSAAASQQVEALGLTAAEIKYYPAADHCGSLAVTALPVNGVTTP